MLSSLWGTRLLHLSCGFAFYLAFQAWGILSETTAAGAPRRRERGAASFALGQAVAITGLVALALLCGRILFQFLHEYGLETLPLWFAGVIAFSEGLAALRKLPLVRDPVAIGTPSFGAGRDLVIRHASPLFLVLSATASWLGPSTSSMIAGGCVTGWGAVQMLGGPSPRFPLPWVRRGAAILGLGMALVFLRAAWKWTF
jgi:hypothetical protein